MDLIFENYQKFLDSNSSDLKNYRDSQKMLNDDGMFLDYKDHLTEGYDQEVKTVCSNVMDMQRNYLLHEATNVPASSIVSGWTVQSFPILVNIYSDPLIAKLCNVWPTNKPIVTVPRMWIMAKTRSYDGKITDAIEIPNANKYVGADFMTVDVAPDTVYNIYTSLGLPQENMKMNQRYTLLTSMVIEERDPVDALVGTHTVNVNFRPDNRNQINNTFDFRDTAKNNTEGRVSGNVNYDNGDIQLHVNFMKGTAGNTYKCSFGQFSLKFRPEDTLE